MMSSLLFKLWLFGDYLFSIIRDYNQVCTSYAPSLHRYLNLVHTQTEIVQTSLHKVYTWEAKTWKMFTQSLKNTGKKYT